MGSGYWVLVWDGWGSGLNMINPRLLVDDDGNNWWPSPHGATVDEVETHAIAKRGLPWLDDGNPEGPDHEEDWPGSVYGSQDYANWKVIL